MMYRIQVFSWRVALAAGLLLALPAARGADELDSALRGGDMGKVLDLLGPGEVEETVRPDPTPAEAPDSDSGDEAVAHRVPLVTPGPAAGKIHVTQAVDFVKVKAEETPAVTPEDRNQAAAELVKLLKDLNAPAPSPKSAQPEHSAATPQPPDEDLDRRKPLAISTRPPSAAPATRGPGTTSPEGAPAVAAMAPRDLVRQTRTDLEGLLHDAKSDAFGKAAAAPPPRQGSVSKAGWRYDGQWRDGHMDGFGVLTYPDGWTYEGQWQEGRVIGIGTLTHPDGWKYTGEWRDGRMDGEGTLTYPDGWRYVGEWRDGKMHGKGELIHPDG